MAPGTAQAAAASFPFTGSPQTYTVPAGVTSVSVRAGGAQGGSNGGMGLSSNGGNGGIVEAVLKVTPGEVLQVNVGGQGDDYTNAGSAAATAGWNGGGRSGALQTSGFGTDQTGGGGASDVRAGSCAATSSCTDGARVLVAGGGGGAGTSADGGAGGTPGGDGVRPTFNAPAMGRGYGGSGATASSGGAGGAGGLLNLGQTPVGQSNAGQNGTAGQGGDGAKCTSCPDPVAAANAELTGGGGGGGGYYGGGGGGSGLAVASGGSQPNYYYGGGGGGGSSYVSPSRVWGNSTFVSGSHTGDGLVTITPGPVVGTASLPDTANGAAYSQTLTASGGDGAPFGSWAVDTGAMPGGLSLSPTTGEISGTVAATSGTYTFTVSVADTNGNVGLKELSIIVLPGPNAPTNVAAAVATGTGKLNVSWTASTSPNVTSYKVYTGTSNSGPWTLVSSGGCAAPASSPCQFSGTPSTVYWFAVSAVNASAAEGDKSVPDDETAIEVPIVIVPVMAAPNGDRSMSVSWMGISTAANPIVSLVVEVSEDNGPFTAVPGGTCLTAPVAGCSATGLTAGASARFRVRASNAAGPGPDGPPSIPMTVLAAPAVPTNVAAVANGHNSIGVSWTAVTGAISYKVYRATASGGPYTLIATTACNAPVASPCSNTSLVPAQTYYYKVSAVGAALESAQSAAVSATAFALPHSPNQPVATVDGALSLSVAWAPMVDAMHPVDTYVVEISDNGGTSYTTVTTGACAAPAVGPCTVTNLTAGTAYRFRVSGVNAAGTGGASPESVDVTAVGPPGTPTAVAVVPSGTGSVSVSWTASTGGPDSYRVYVATSSGGPYTRVASGACNTPVASPCVVTGLTNGTTYYFTVSAVKSVAESPQSTAGTGVPVTAPDAPNAPALAVTGAAKLSVTWTGPTATAGKPVTGYKVQISENGGEYTAVNAGCVNPTASPCTLSGLTPGSTYRVKVIAVNGAGDGAPSAPSGPATAVDLPLSPETPAATLSADAAVQLAWTGPTGTGARPVTGYRVYVSKDGGSYTESTTGGCATPAASPCTVTGLVIGAAYRFKVAAVNAAGPGDQSTQSNQVTAAVGPAAPTITTAASGDTTAVITWTPAADTTGITGYRASVTPGDLHCEATGAAATTCTITGLTNKTAYTVTVVALGTVNSAPSGSKTVTPSAAPTKPTGVQASAGTSSATVTWTAPANLGDGIARYAVVADPGPARCETADATATSCVVGAEAGRSFTYRVIAIGAYGNDSDPSDPSSTVSASTPQPPAVPPATEFVLTTDKGNITTAEPSQDIVVIGDGFAPHSTVVITIYSDPVVLGTVVTDGDGKFSKPVTVPASLAAGVHSLVAGGVDALGQARSMRLDVTVASDSLAVTGSNVMLLLMIGLAFAAAGAGLVCTSKL
ncbi:fibronectin type III domain-containing protein [Dactylosporangium siamense]|uniref:fibronectin type III domain-containing protein n=1 Tax=Dactylosporangium siamense TaxID=685454 RepID=UPI0019411230|nr:fibronectin type III domain-containing protein [Dactylosporangium siamense]